MSKVHQNALFLHKKGKSPDPTPAREGDTPSVPSAIAPTTKPYTRLWVTILVKTDKAKCFLLPLNVE